MKTFTTVEMVKAKIKYLEEKTKRQTNLVNANKSRRIRIFDELSKEWLAFYMDLNSVASEMEIDEYKLYLEKLYMLRDNMTDFAILLTTRKKSR